MSGRGTSIQPSDETSMQFFQTDVSNKVCEVDGQLRDALRASAVYSPSS